MLLNTLKLSRECPTTRITQPRMSIGKESLAQYIRFNLQKTEWLSCLILTQLTTALKVKYNIYSHDGRISIIEHMVTVRFPSREEVLKK
jgi:hypothetical protein